MLSEKFELNKESLKDIIGGFNMTWDDSNKSVIVNGGETTYYYDDDLEFTKCLLKYVPRATKDAGDGGNEEYLKHLLQYLISDGVLHS